MNADMFNLEIVLIALAVPAAMLVVLAWVARRFKRHIDPARRSAASTVDDYPKPVASGVQASRPLQLQWFRADDARFAEPGDAPGQTGTL